MPPIQTTWKYPQEMRISASGIQPLDGMLSVSCSSHFGQQICDRHRRTQSFQHNDVEAILNNSGVSLKLVHQHSTLHLKPNLSFTVLNWQVPASDTVNSLPRLPTSTLVIPSSQATQSVVTLRCITQPEKLVEQVETQKQRVEQKITTVVSATQFNQELLQHNQQIQETSQIVVKSLPKVIKQVMAEPTSLGDAVMNSGHKPLMPPKEIVNVNPDSWISHRTEKMVASRQADQLLNAIDVNRLTDQVVQAIDRRLIAYRERLGRM